MITRVEVHQMHQRNVRADSDDEIILENKNVVFKRIYDSIEITSRIDLEALER